MLPAMHEASVDFPAPFGPRIEQMRARRDLDRHLVQRLERAVGVAEAADAEGGAVDRPPW